MRIVWMGTPDFSSHILRRVYAAGYEIAGVVTAEDTKKGRSGKLRPSDVAIVAEELGIPVLKTKRVRDPEQIETVMAWEPDLIVTAAFGQIVPPELLYGPRMGCINVHASLLPAHRGASPIQRAILAGDEQTGITIMQMDEGLDTGDILTSASVPITEEDTAGSLFDKCADLGADLLIRTLPMIEQGKVTPEPQPKDSPTPYAAMIRKQDGVIDWTQDAAYLSRFVRAMDPWPAATTSLHGELIRVLGGYAVPAQDARWNDGTPGDICCADEDGILVATGDGLYCVTRLCKAGKKAMAAAEFLRGYRGTLDRFGTEE